MGTYDSPCERHLYAVPLTNPAGGPGGSAKPVKLTGAPCMHNVIMDHRLRRWANELGGYGSTIVPRALAC
ncbi:unnamed protein product, partial [Hapterophycus canaliculatus]